MAKKETLKEVVFFNHGIDETFDERGNSSLKIRKLQWGNVGDEPDENKSKLELRKWIYIGDSGEERASKGFTFLTEQGPHKLAEKLVELGFGNSDTITGFIKKRK